MSTICVLNAWFPGLVLPASLNFLVLFFSKDTSVFTCKCEGRNAYISEPSYFCIFFNTLKFAKVVGLCSQKKLQNARISFTMCVCLCTHNSVLKKLKIF